MSELRARDYKELLSLIDIVYSIQDCTAMFQAIWQKLDTWIGIGSAVWLPVDAESKQFVFKDLLPFNTPIKAGLLFTLYYAPLDPLVSSGQVMQPVRACKITDVIAPSRLPDTEYDGHEVEPMTPLVYEMAATIQSQGDLLGCIGLHRLKRDGDFTERHSTILNLFLPHLANAIHTLYLRDALTQSHDKGMIVGKAKRHAQPMNDEAKLALNGRSVDTLPVSGSGTEPVLFETEAGLYRVRSMPVRVGSREKIMILDPVPNTKVITRKLEEFGLTRREQEIAGLVIGGLSNCDIADRLCIAEQTVKDQLHHVFEKINIHRRCELTATVFGLRLQTPLA
jgi:DNA-binding CsgD family transcriptional regulator